MPSAALQRAQKRKSEIKKEHENLKNKIKALEVELGHLNYFFESLGPHATRTTEPVPKITVVAGTTQILKREKKYLDARQITDFLIGIGYKTTAKFPLESIRAIISEEIRKKVSPRIIRKGKHYGLPGWLNDPREIR